MGLKVLNAPIINILIGLIGFYLTVLILLYVFQSQFIFLPRKISSAQKSFLIKFEQSEVSFHINDQILHGWFINKGINKNNPIVIYYGGNAEEVSQNLYDLSKFSGHSLLLINYRGYGNSSGKPSEKNLLNDALAIFDTFKKDQDIKGDEIILMGRSLGTSVATYVAANRDIKAIILVTPFDNLVHIAQNYYPVFPIAWLLKHQFRSDELAPKINIPMLALLAENDQIIPNENSMNLVKKWGGSKIQKVIINADHNSISVYKSYWIELNTFLLDHSN